MQFTASDSIRTVPPFTDQVCGLIKNVILNGTYRPNQRLKELELSRSLGISRSPIREALQRLANEGLVKIVPRKGAFVQDLSLKEVQELFEVREAAEMMSIRLALERAEPEDLLQLSEFLHLTKNAIEKDQYSMYPWDLDFHLQVAKCAKNKKLEDYVYQVNAQLLLARYRSAQVSGRALEALNEHLAIFEALRTRDSRRAEKLMADHLHRSKENMTKIFDSEEGDQRSRGVGVQER